MSEGRAPFSLSPGGSHEITVEISARRRGRRFNGRIFAVGKMGRVIATVPYDVIAQRRPLVRPNSLSLSSAQPSARVEVMFIEDRAPSEQPIISELEDGAFEITASRRDDYAWVVDFRLGKRPIHGSNEVFLSWGSHKVKVTVSSVSISQFHPTEFLIDTERQNPILRVEVDSLPNSSRISCVNKLNGNSVPFDLVKDSVSNIIAVKLRPLLREKQKADTLILTAKMGGGISIKQEISWTSVKD